MPSRLPPPQLRAGLVTEAVPRVPAFLREVTGRIPAELGHIAEVMPRPGVAEELAQEPVHGVNVIAPPRHMEADAPDQRADRPAGVEFRRDATEQVVDLCRVITPRSPDTPASEEPCVPYIAAVQERSPTAGPGP